MPSKFNFELPFSGLISSINAARKAAFNTNAGSDATASDDVSAEERPTRGLPQSRRDAPAQESGVVSSEFIRWIEDELPHLAVLNEPLRNKTVDLLKFDYESTLIRSSILRVDEVERLPVPTTVLRRFALGDVEDVRVRLVMATDLSTDLMASLGLLFGVAPEIFAEHLNNSGIAKSPAIDLPPESWRTSAMDKTYVSIKWFRPFYRKNTLESSAAFRSELLKAGPSGFSWEEGDAASSGIKHELSIASNIYRPDWDLWIDNSEGMPCAVEERVSLCFSNIDDCLVVLLLMDPLPQIKHTTYRLEKPAQQGWRDIIHSFENTNTEKTGSSPATLLDEEQDSPYRSAMPRGRPFSTYTDMLSYTGNPRMRKDKKTFLGGTRSTREDIFDWLRAELEVTASPQTRVFGPMSVLLRMIVSDTSLLLKLIRASLAKIRHSMSSETLNAESLLRWRSLILRFQGVLPELEHSLLESVKNLETHTESMQKRLGLRLGPDPAIPQQAGFSQPQSSREHRPVVDSQPTPHHPNTPPLETGPAQSAHPSTRSPGTAPLQSAESAPSNINSSQTASSKLDASPTGRSPTANFPKVPRLSELLEFQELMVQFSAARDLADRTFSALMANMQIIESRRAIEEAESVTKLTELAFFYIPLTFAATIFGMQIKELNSRVPLSTFFALAISLTVFSYTLRLVVRSTHVGRYKQAWETRVRHFNDLPKTSSIPNSAYVAWFYGRLGPGLGFVFIVLGVLAACLSALWTRGLNKGLKAVTTVIIVLLVLFCTWVILRLNENIREYVFEGSTTSWFRERRTKKKSGRVWEGGSRGVKTGDFWAANALN